MLLTEFPTDETVIRMVIVQIVAARDAPPIVSGIKATGSHKYDE